MLDRILSMPKPLAALIWLSGFGLFWLGGKLLVQRIQNDIDALDASDAAVAKAARLHNVLVQADLDRVARWEKR